MSEHVEEASDQDGVIESPGGFASERRQRILLRASRVPQCRSIGVCGRAPSPKIQEGTLFRPDSEGSRHSDKEGVTMIMFRSRTADAAELFALEFRFPFATTFISLFLVAN